MRVGIENAPVAGLDDEKQRIAVDAVLSLTADAGSGPVALKAVPAMVPAQQPVTGAPPTAEPRWLHGWPVPSSISHGPDEARACIYLPEFDASILEKARIISDQFPLAEADYRRSRAKESGALDRDLPRFERVFRLAAMRVGFHNIQTSLDYDELLILTAWQSVRPRDAGYLGSYPKSLLCPLSHTAPPVALDSLTASQRIIFERRAPFYLRYLLCERFGLRTCADIEHADLRHLLRSIGFRLIRASAVPETAFPGIARGDDPPVRPWMLTLRQELTDDRAAQMLIHAARWQIQHGLRLVTFQGERPRWNIGAFERTDWEAAFLSLGVRASPAYMRPSGQLDWRKVLARCLEEIGSGNLPLEVLAQVSTVPQRVSHDDREAIWSVLDRAARTVLDQVRVSEPQLFHEDGRLHYEQARTFRRWVRLFDEVSPNILSRFGVSAFTALHRVAPAHFGWGCQHLKPWELEQEHGKWKGPRGRALLRSAYAFALFESGLGALETREDEVIWVCTQAQFSDWAGLLTDRRTASYRFLYGIASRHGLTPLLNREITHTAAVSLLAGINLHEQLPRIEGCWDLCMGAALERHAGRLEVRLTLPDLVPLPLRLRKAVIAPLSYGYLHKEIRLVRDFDLRMARESRRTLMEIPGWWDDERVLGTPLMGRVMDPRDPARVVLDHLRPEPWLEHPARTIRFRALYLLLSKQATARTTCGEAGLTSGEIRILLQLALEATLDHTNIAQVSIPAVRRGMERLLAREDTRELLDSLLLHIGTAYETEAWGQARKFIVLDVINDLLTLTIRSSLLHVMSSE